MAKKISDTMTKKFSGAELEALRIDRQSVAWEYFSLSNDPAGLAMYLEAGGKIHADVRKIIIGFLRNEISKNNRGGRNNAQYYLTFLSVTALSKYRKISTTAACKEFASQNNRELRTVQKQYDRGKVLAQTRP